MAFHLDGARIFNALVETGESTLDWGSEFDSISICLSKGLGAPIGSLLIGNKDFIAKARRFRKVMGGGMRQAGYLAAAGIYALDNHVERLKDDNRRSRVLGDKLRQQSWVADVRPVQTNILIFDLVPPLKSETFLKKLLENGVAGTSFGPATVRLTTHLDFTEEMLGRVVEVIENLRF